MIAFSNSRREIPRQRRRFWGLLTPICGAFGAFLLLSGCGTASYRPIDPPVPDPISYPPGSPPPTAGQAGSVTINPQYIALAPGQSFQFTATVTGGAQTEWMVNNIAGGNSTYGTVDSSGKYTAPASITQSENVVVTVAVTAAPQTNYATAVVSIVVPGQFICPFDLGTPQVAKYTVYLPAPGKVSVQFGATTSYGLNTWQVPTPSANGGTVQLYVAGMVAQTMYHMRPQIALDDGATLTGADQVCNSGVPPATVPMTISTNGTPQPGIEMWNPLVEKGSTNQAFATDLKGNVIWTYTYPHPQGDLIQGIQLMPNGNLLMTISYLSSLTTAQPTTIFNEIREVDLAGNTVVSLTMDALNQKLAAGNFRDAQGNLYQLGSFHHDVLALPNGHMVALATYDREYSNLTGISGSVDVIGDALVDLDQNFNPDWVWNTFDHLDVNRHPMQFSQSSPDWTHSNGMLYSTDDHNLLLSMRHQNWIIKINFLDGKGSGDVMWRLGEGGDFKLVGATDPTDWFYAQHGMNYFSANTTGVWRIGMMDNGNDRIFPSGQVICKPYSPQNAQCYSTMPVLEIDENAMTATMLTHYSPGPKDFSFFGGNAELLANGDMEVDFCAAPAGALVQELDPTGAQIVWQSYSANTGAYHVYRMPSLYPGVQW